MMFVDTDDFYYDGFSHGVHRALSELRSYIDDWYKKYDEHLTTDGLLKMIDDVEHQLEVKRD